MKRKANHNTKPKADPLIENTAPTMARISITPALVAAIHATQAGQPNPAAAGPFLEALAWKNPAVAKAAAAAGIDKPKRKQAGRPKA